MNHDTQTEVGVDSRDCGFGWAGDRIVGVHIMSAGRCECENPGCSNHEAGEYKCGELAKGILTDDNGYSMELCPGCAVSEMTGLELASPDWELFEQHAVIELDGRRYAELELRRRFAFTDREISEMIKETREGDRIRQAWIAKHGTA